MAPSRIAIRLSRMERRRSERLEGLEGGIEDPDLVGENG